MTEGLDNVSLNLIDSVDDAFEFMRWLSTVKGPLAFDVETTGLSIEQDTVRLAQFGDDNTGWAMDFSKWAGVVEDVRRKWEGDYVGHNSPFDYGMLKKHEYEIPTHKIHDTRLMVHTIDPVNSTALKAVASRLVDRSAAGLSRQLDQALGSRGGWTWADVPIVAEGPMSIYWSYGALDTVLTRRVFDKLAPQVRAECPQAYAIELAASWVVERMQRKGCVIDRPFVEEKSKAFGNYVIELEKWCIENYGVKPGSNVKVVEVLEQHGFEFTKVTKTGAKVLDKEVLEQIDHPLAEAVFNRRRVQKLESTYLRRFIEYSEYDGLLHPSINIIGGSDRTNTESGGGSAVRTGRMSMSNPNLQQLPRKGTFRPADVVRNAIIARPGNILIMCDFDQVEMRIMAHLSKDPGLINAFIKYDDFFSHLGAEIYHDPNFQKSDPRRPIVKNTGYCTIYGGGIEKISQTAKVSYEEAEYTRNRFDQLYPGVPRFMMNVINEGKKRLEREGLAYARSPLTNRRLVADDDRVYALTNYMIQGCAAELMKMKLIQLDMAGLGEYMILPVHDEIILDVPRENASEVIHTLQTIMNDDSIFSVPITAGVSYGERWGEKVELK